MLDALLEFFFFAYTVIRFAAPLLATALPVPVYTAGHPVPFRGPVHPLPTLVHLLLLTLLVLKVPHT